MKTDRSLAMASSLNLSPTPAPATLFGLRLIRTALRWTSAPKRKPWLQLTVAGGLALLTLGGAGPGELFERIAAWPGYGRGPAMDVAVVSHYAYVAAGAGGLIILDVTDPSQPTRVGGYWAAGTTRHVRVEGVRGYVTRTVRGGGGCDASHRGSLDVLDLTDPVHPKLLGAFATSLEIKDLQIVGQQAYLVDVGLESEYGFLASDGLQVVDVSDPAHLVGLGARAIGGARALYVANGRVSVVDSGSLYVAGLGLPPQGDWAASAQLTNPPDALWIQGDNAYVGQNSGLSVFNLNAPGTRISYQDTPKPVLGLSLVGHILYAAAAEAGLEVFDLSNPNTPARVATLGTSGRAVALTVSGHHAYIAAYGGGLQIVDVNDPGSPIWKGSYDTGLTTRQAQVLGDRAFILSGDQHENAVKGKSRLELVNLTNLAQPTLLGVYETPGHVSHFSAGGNLACLLRNDSNEVDVVDWSNPAQPVQVSSISGNIADVELSGTNAFTVGRNGLRIFSLQDPTRPSQIGTYVTSWYSTVRVRDRYAYLANDSTIEVVDVSNPAQPAKVGEWTDEVSHSQSVFGLAGNQAYLAGSGPLTIINAVQPTQLSRLASCEPAASVSSVDADGRYAYLAEGDAGLEVIDVSNPAQPDRVPGWEAASSVNSVEAQNGLVYIADAGLGLLILKPRADLAIVTPPESQTIAVGQSAAVSVFASGPGPLAYQWYWGQSGDTSAPIAGATGTSYTLQSVQKDARVWARVSSRGGSVESPAARIGIAMPLALEPIGMWPGYRMGPANAVEVGGNYAYVAAGSGGLMVFDVSNPSAPRRLGGWRTADPANGVALSSQYALVTAGQSLQVLDVSQPAQPVVVGSYSSSNSLSGVTVAGHFAYAWQNWWDPSLPRWAESGTLNVLDISQPTNPRCVGAYVTSQLAGMVVSGSRGYLAETWHGQWGPRSRLEVIDLSDPANPQSRGGYTVGWNGSSSGGVAVRGNYAYLISGSSIDSEFDVFDISDPAWPQELSSFATYADDRYTVPGRPTLAGNYLYLPNGGSVAVFDVTNPRQPKRADTYQSDGSPQKVTVAGALAYVAAGDAGLEIVDVSNPAQPRRLGSFDTSRSPARLSLAPPYALFTCADAGLEILDVSNPRQPQAVSYDNSVAGNSCVVAALPYAYVGTNVLDLSNPATPKHAGQLGTNGPPRDLAIHGSYAYAAYGGAPYSGTPSCGLRLFDLQNPAQPQRAGGYHTAIANAVAVSSNLVCLASGAEGLSVYDVSIPVAPVRLGTYYSWGDAQDVVLSNRVAHLATIPGQENNQNVGGGLETLDLSDPTRPVCLARSLTETNVQRVCLAGRYVFALDGGGLEIVDVSRPDQPLLAGHYDAPEANDVAVDGDLIYLAQGSYGLTVLRMSLALRLNPPALTANGVRLSWLGFPGVNLQWSPRLSPAQWQDVPGTMGASQVDLPLSSATGFFRLSQP